MFSQAKVLCLALALANAVSAGTVIIKNNCKQNIFVYDSNGDTQHSLDSGQVYSEQYQTMDISVGVASRSDPSIKPQDQPRVNVFVSPGSEQVTYGLREVGKNGMKGHPLKLQSSAGCDDIEWKDGTQPQEGNPSVTCTGRVIDISLWVC